MPIITVEHCAESKHKTLFILQGRVVQSPFKLTQGSREFLFQFYIFFLVKSSVYIVCPSVLCCSNLKLRQTLEERNIFKQENIMLQLTFNPGLTLTGFRTTRPRRINFKFRFIMCIFAYHNLENIFKNLRTL